MARGGDDSTALFHANWHTGYDLFWTIAPFVGVSATAEGGVYGYAGLYADIMLTDHIFVMPSFAAGAFADGGGKDMGSAIEFRSSITAGYRFDGGIRVGAFYNHISNAGIDDRNPGADTAGISVTFPISLF